MIKVSLHDLSKSLNISKGTISLVLNGKGDEKCVSKETQEKIIEFAKEHHYNANQLSRGLSRGKSEMIGLVVADIADSFFLQKLPKELRKGLSNLATTLYSAVPVKPGRVNQN